MNKITVYEKPKFEGLSREFTSRVSNLNEMNFDDCISSLKVVGSPWVLYSEPDFKGYQYIFEEGEYPTMNWKYDNLLSLFSQSHRPSSLEPVTENLEDPQITLYDKKNYEGKNVVLTEEANLRNGSFNDAASSHKVQRGAWVLYQHHDRGGYQILARASQDMPDYGWFSDRLTSLRPLKPGKPTITARVLWDQKEEQVKSVIIDSIYGVNNGSREQTFSTELSREYVGCVTESFNFGNATQISFETKFTLNLMKVKTDNTLSLSNTFTVENGKTNTRTEKKSVKVSLPTTIPPHKKITVNIVRKEVEVKVPVELTITTGFHEKTELGTYTCSDGSSITTEFQEEPLINFC